jgi:glycosyltransferase involved in cell wall biosynthesis
VPFDKSIFEYEKVLAHAADGIAAPSREIARIVGSDWLIPKKRMSVFSLPFESKGELEKVSTTPIGIGSRILFVGRLEPRKGVQHLGRALRLLNRRWPNAVLRCVGSIGHAPIAGQRMDDYLKRKAGPSAAKIDFAGALPRERLAAEFENADICVFPSLWENFPYVCLEAMTAGRAIVGSEAGGMAEMLADGAGVTVKPGSPERWAEAIGHLLADGAARQRLGQAARGRVLTQYSYQQILPKQIACYEEAIKHRREQGPRHPNLIPPRPQSKTA